MPKLWADSLDEHRALVRRRLVDAFVELVEEHGLEEVTVSAVAVRADLARSAVYNHVDHLHDLALWHAEEVMGDWLADLQRDEAPGGAWARLEALVRASLAVFASDPLAGLDLGAHLDADRSARLFGHLQPILAHLQAIVADGVASGEFVDEDPGDLAGFVWTTIGGHRTVVGQGRLPVDHATDVLVRLLARAVRRHPDPTGPA